MTWPIKKIGDLKNAFDPIHLIKIKTTKTKRDLPQIRRDK